MTSHMPRGAH